MKYLFLLLSPILLVGCSSQQPTQQPSLTPPLINEIVIRNDSGDQIDQVNIKVNNINGLFSCNHVLAGSVCLNKFPIRAYQGNPVIISWIQQYKPWTSGQLTLTLPDKFKPSKPLRAIVVIGNDGQVSASMDQMGYQNNPQGQINY